MRLDGGVHAGVVGGVVSQVNGGVLLAEIISVASRGVEALDDGAIIGNKLRIKATGINDTAGAVNSVRFRFLLDSGEKGDATIYFEKAQA